MVIYPAELPLPLREGYAFKSESPIIRTQMQSGRARQRRKYKRVPTYPSVSWLMSSPQASLFMAWFDEALNSGADWFLCPLRTPLGLDKYQARFIDIYEGPELVGVSHWRFTATLELFTTPLFEPGWAGTLPSYIIESDIVDRAVNEKWPKA